MICICIYILVCYVGTAVIPVTPPNFVVVEGVYLYGILRTAVTEPPPLYSCYTSKGVYLYIRCGIIHTAVMRVTLDIVVFEGKIYEVYIYICICMLWYHTAMILYV